MLQETKKIIKKGSNENLKQIITSDQNLPLNYFSCDLDMHIKYHKDKDKKSSGNA